MFKKKFILLGMAISFLGSVGFAQKKSDLKFEDLSNKFS